MGEESSHYSDFVIMDAKKPLGNFTFHMSNAAAVGNHKNKTMGFKSKCF